MLAVQTEPSFEYDAFKLQRNAIDGIIDVILSFDQKGIELANNPPPPPMIPKKVC
jgi:hypothetical protein